MNETLMTLRERRSVRRYRPEQIKPEELEAILDAGTWAPSAMGKQSAVMVVVQDRETIQEMSRLNAEIQGAPGTDPFYGAPTVVVVLAEGANAVPDGSLVMGNLMNAAWSLGVASCWINRARELFERPEGKALLRKWGLPEDLQGVGNCILGYADGEIPAPKARKRGILSGPEDGAPAPADVFEYVLIEMERVFRCRGDPLHLLFPARPDAEQ